MNRCSVAYKKAMLCQISFRVFCVKHNFGVLWIIQGFWLIRRLFPIRIYNFYNYVSLYMPFDLCQLFSFTYCWLQDVKIVKILTDNSDELICYVHILSMCCSCFSMEFALLHWFCLRFSWRWTFSDCIFWYRVCF